MLKTLKNSERWMKNTSKNAFNHKDKRYRGKRRSIVEVRQASMVGCGRTTDQDGRCAFLWLTDPYDQHRKRMVDTIYDYEAINAHI